MLCSVWGIDAWRRVHHPLFLTSPGNVQSWLCLSWFFSYHWDNHGKHFFQNTVFVVFCCVCGVCMSQGIWIITRATCRSKGRKRVIGYSQEHKDAIKTFCQPGSIHAEMLLILHFLSYNFQYCKQRYYTRTIYPLWSKKNI